MDQLRAECLAKGMPRLTWRQWNDKLSKHLLSQNGWKPLESVFANDDTINRHEQQQQQTEERKDSPRPIIPLLHEPSLSDENSDRPDSQSSTTLKPVEGKDDAQIHD